MSLETAFKPGVALDRDSPIELCSQILARTEHQPAVTDDNMGTEWRYFWGWE